jgi:hypothetical protein
MPEAGAGARGGGSILNGLSSGLGRVTGVGAGKGPPGMTDESALLRAFSCFLICPEGAEGVSGRELETYLPVCLAMSSLSPSSSPSSSSPPSFT